MTQDDITQLINEAVESTNFDDGVVSYIDAFDIVTGSEFPEAEDNDLDGCTSALDALMREANNIYFQVLSQEIYSESQDFAESLVEMIEKAVELGFDGDFQTSCGSIYGWEAHNYETDDGTCIWSDERKTYSYNPSLLEGELWAIEKDISGVTIGACWTPERG